MGQKAPFFYVKDKDYIMPPMPPMPPISGIGGIGASSLGTSVTMASVVIIIPATDPAACNAVLVTFAGNAVAAKEKMKLVADCSKRNLNDVSKN